MFHTFQIFIISLKALKNISSRLINDSQCCLLFYNQRGIFFGTCGRCILAGFKLDKAGKNQNFNYTLNLKDIT